MGRTLLMITLGPVQEFISQARRTRDLWFGSYLLSELSYEVAKCLHTQGAVMIFPNFQIDRRKVANKIVALVDSGMERDFAIMARKAAQDSWLGYAAAAKKKLGACVNEGAWTRQVKDLVEFYAVWVELGGAQGYAQALIKAEELLAARKMLRDFRVNEPGQLYGDAKSDLDPGRESVLWPERYDEYSRFGISKTEALDAISLVKRLAHHIKPDSSTFLSVCDIAFAPLQQKFRSNREWKKAADDYQVHAISCIEKVTGIKLPNPDHGQPYHSWLFYGNRMEDYLIEHFAGHEMGQLNELIIRLQVELSEFYLQTKLHTTPYYVLVLCDGDHMHRRLKKISDPAGHQELSAKLSNFSDQAEKVFANNQGILIYSGGDDVMGLLPVTTCFDAIVQLKDRFQALMNVEGQSDRVTLSVGMAIAHMYEPLEEVRQQALLAEKMAKEKRDSLAVWFQKRSGGSQMRISIPFSHFPDQWIRRFQCLFMQRILSRKYVYDLRGLYQQYESLFSNGDWLDEQEQIELLEQELIRLAVKKRPETISKQQMKEYMIPLCEMMRSMVETSDPTVSRTPLESLKIIAEMGIVAAEIMQEGGG